MAREARGWEIFCRKIAEFLLVVSINNGGPTVFWVSGLSEPDESSDDEETVWKIYTYSKTVLIEYY